MTYAAALIVGGGLPPSWKKNSARAENADSAMAKNTLIIFLLPSDYPYRFDKKKGSKTLFGFKRIPETKKPGRSSGASSVPDSADYGS
jgi:hypothetical protein